ncbi:MAG TPA: phosphoribosylglycinamide formyltransferase [Burkholderiales bacterium]|nr:phosphoribosylglycinamide formyltransferase [Burkholderiales bacterium]
MKRIVILISGRGSNMQALLEARLPAEVAAVMSNNPGAQGLDIARRFGVACSTVDHRDFGERAAFDAALAAAIDQHRPDLVVLAGFMRVFTEPFVARYRGRMLNIHPSLLPAFPGLRTHRRALAAGVRIHGCTVHFVSPDVDHGPIVVQAAVPVLAGDSEAQLAARVLRQEHRIYPSAVRWFCEERLRLSTDGRVELDVPAAAERALIVPPAN